VQEQLRKLKSQAENQAMTLSEKEKQLEERQIKIDLLESRTKETKQISDTMLKLKTEVEALRVAKETVERELEQSMQDMQALTRTRQDELAELETLKKAHLAGDNVILPGTLGAQNETLILQLRSEMQFLSTEMLSLQATVRYLKMENYKLRIPPATTSTSTASHAWLDISTLTRPRPSEATGRLKAESEDVFNGLLDLVKTSKPVALKPLDASSKTSWRAAKDTPKYKALQKREEVERWHEWKNDLVKRARVLGREPRRPAPIQTRAPPRKAREQSGNDIEIVGSPPR
jgi:myosin heavy subunit